MGSLRIQPLADKHLADVVEIEKRSQSAPWTEQSFKREIDNPQGAFLVAVDESKVVGYGGYWLVVDEAHIITIAVDPDRRGTGVGRQLLTEMLAKAQDSKAVCATLEVRASNDAALRLYEGMGFKSVGRRKRYYPDNREDAVVMWLYDLDKWTVPEPPIPAPTAD